MKKLTLITLAFLLILFASCRNEPEQAIPTTTEVTGTTTWNNSFPSDWPASSPEVKKNRDAIFELLPESAYEHWRAAYYTADGIANLFEKIGIPELKEIEIIESDLDGYYLVRFVDINDDAYRIHIGKEYGGGSFGPVWKEGEENPIYSVRM